MWAITCVCRHVCHMQAQSCLSTGWALNCCFAWFFETPAVLAQRGGGAQALSESVSVLHCATWNSKVSPHSLGQFYLVLPIDVPSSQTRLL